MSTAGAGVLVLFGVTAALAAAAASAHGEPHRASAVVDSTLPPGLERQVIHALSTSQDPTELEGLAAQLDAQGYPLTAQACRARAAELAPGARGARAPKASAASSVTPPTALGALDAGIDPDTAQAVLAALQTEPDPAKLVGFAHELDGQYPKAAAALIARAAALQAAVRADQAAEASAQGLDPSLSTVTTPGTPESEPQVAIVASPDVSADQASSPAIAAATSAGPLPTGPGIWRLASDADVARDGTSGRFAVLLHQPVGTVIRERHGGRLWQFRVLSHAHDPNLTAYVRDVKAWIWQDSASPMAVVPPPPPLLPVVSSATLRSAPPSAAVRAVQHNLNLLGASPPLVEDGKLGPKTIQTIQAFQRAHGLKVDGIAGPQTNRAIASLLHGAGAPPPRVQAAPGARSVALLQHNLNLLGASPPLVEDGKLGPRTIQTIQAFQHAHGLKVDGIAGPQTHRAIAIALGAPGPSAPTAIAPPPARPPPPARGPFPGPSQTILMLQRHLNALGASPPLVEDGVEGPKTVAALRTFQASQGLVVDGIAGPKTYAAITAALALSGPPAPPAPIPPPPAPPAPPAPLRLASVRDIQHALNALGVIDPRLIEDGKMGPKTKAAIQLFQRQAGLTIDGIIGPQTRAALQAALAQIGAAA